MSLKIRCVQYVVAAEAGLQPVSTWVHVIASSM